MRVGTGVLFPVVAHAAVKIAGIELLGKWFPVPPFFLLRAAVVRTQSADSAERERAPPTEERGFKARSR